MSWDLTLDASSMPDVVKIITVIRKANLVIVYSSFITFLFVELCIVFLRFFVSKSIDRKKLYLAESGSKHFSLFFASVYWWEVKCYRSIDFLSFFKWPT